LVNETKNTSDQQYLMTLDCVGLTQSSVIWIIHRNVGLKSFFIDLNVCYCHWFFLHLYFTR